MDENQQADNQNLNSAQDNTQETSQNQTQEPKWYREAIAKANEEKAKLKAELEAIRKAEEDKNKSTEEKLLEIKKEKEELELKYKQEKTLSKLEKELLKNNLNPEFSNLILKEARDSLNDDSNLEDVIQNLKTSYPSAFVEKKEAKPIGNVGLSATTSSKSDKNIEDMSLEEFAKYRLKNSNN